MKMDDHAIPFSAFDLDVGVRLGKSPSMEAHVHKVCASAFAHLRLISRIKRSFSKQSCFAIHALVLSRIDYCPPLLYGINQKLL